MKQIMNIWDDIKQGENIDLYLTVFVSITLALLNIFGLAHNDWIPSITLAVLGLLAVSSLVNRKKIEDALKDAKERDGNFLDCFPADWQERMENADELWVVGVNLSRTVVSYFSLFEQKLKRGNTLKFLLVDPNGEALRISGMRRPESGYTQQNLALLQSTLQSLCELKRIAGRNIEIRIIDYPMSFGVFAVDPNTPKGAIYLSYYPFKNPGGAVPKLVLQPQNGKWYDQFKDEMENLWNNSVAFE